MTFKGHSRSETMLTVDREYIKLPVGGCDGRKIIHADFLSFVVTSDAKYFVF